MPGYVTISTATVGSWVSFYDRGNNDTQSARVSRTALLDGTVDIQHYGFSDGDRTRVLSGDITATQAETLKTIFQDYTLHALSADDGVYSGVIESVKITKAGLATVTFLIKEKKS